MNKVVNMLLKWGRKKVSCVCSCTCVRVCVVKVRPSKSVIVHWTAHLLQDFIGCWLVLLWLTSHSLLWRKFQSLHLQPSTSFLITEALLPSPFLRADLTFSHHFVNEWWPFGWNPLRFAALEPTYIYTWTRCRGHACAQLQMHGLKRCLNSCKKIERL